MGQSVAGACRGDRVVWLLKPAPWDFVVDWIRSMGATMTPTEQQAIAASLQTTYPATPYPFAWAKVPAALGEGGWNGVTLKEDRGYLYAGFERKGTIVRSAEGSHWQVVTESNH